MPAGTRGRSLAIGRRVPLGICLTTVHQIFQHISDVGHGVLSLISTPVTIVQWCLNYTTPVNAFRQCFMPRCEAHGATAEHGVNTAK
jgi:hypothetical protein